MIRGSAHIPVSSPKLSPQESAHLHRTCEVLCHSQFPLLTWSRRVSLVSHRQFLSPKILSTGEFSRGRRSTKITSTDTTTAKTEMKKTSTENDSIHLAVTETHFWKPTRQERTETVLSAYMWRTCEPSNGRHECGTPCLLGSQNPCPTAPG